MARFARIPDNTVLEIIVADILPEFHEDIAATFHQVPDNVEEGWITTDFVNYTAPIAQFNPLATVTDAVKVLPVGLRTDASFGTFVSQCLLAIQNQDTESLGYLINNAIAATPDASYKGFRTSEPAYVQLLTNAKELFGV